MMNHLRAVLKLLGELIESPAREARQLNKDAVAVIEQLEATHNAKAVAEVACLVGAELEQALVRVAAGTSEPSTETSGEMSSEDKVKSYAAPIVAYSESSLKSEIRRNQALHREARRSFNQTGFSAYTLVIIFLRSLSHAERTEPARAAIRQFLERWPSAQHDEISVAL